MNIKFKLKDSQLNHLSALERRCIHKMINAGSTWAKTKRKHFDVIKGDGDGLYTIKINSFETTWCEVLPKWCSRVIQIQIR